ncbi:hypothetical protein EJ04DRAFT_579861 [Polyplosphaeria fusca]|uniref:Uncharacterized protein n=1 Tax=Polyplosphaeria fusca TaxID=682080 RepID=A0A9P4QRQ9_9PLEO|nr:hypothetical protein EJ04DRAFT_579861 [Polyplosphaeria fusca]
MFSKIFFFGLMAVTMATPTPGQKGWRDNRPTGVPVWHRVDAEDLTCGDSCSWQCWQFTKTSVSVSGTSNFAQYAGFHASASLGDTEVVPNKDFRCLNCNDLVAPGNNNGWELTLKTAGAPMEGPLPIYLKFPWETALFSADTGGPFMSDQVIGDDGFECDVWTCGGGMNPMQCRNCKFAASYSVYQATGIEDCSYWED